MGRSRKKVLKLKPAFGYMEPIGTGLGLMCAICDLSKLGLLYQCKPCCCAAPMESRVDARMAYSSFINGKLHWFQPPFSLTQQTCSYDFLEFALLVHQ